MRRSIEEDAGTSGERAERPSRSALKRAAEAAQVLGERLVALDDGQLRALSLPERLHDAIIEARALRSHGARLRQRQYIGRLMREVDVAAIEAALAARTRGTALEAERLRRIEAWRDRLLREGRPALEELARWRADLDVAALGRLLTEATDARRSDAQRTSAARALFRSLRAAFDSSGSDGEQEPAGRGSGDHAAADEPGPGR